MHGEAVLERKLFDWRERYFVAASGRPIRLRPHSYDFMSISETLAQRGNSSLRCSHENDSHAELFRYYRSYRTYSNNRALGGRRFTPGRCAKLFCGDLRLQEEQQIIASAGFRIGTRHVEPAKRMHAH